MTGQNNTEEETVTAFKAQPARKVNCMSPASCFGSRSPLSRLGPHPLDGPILRSPRPIHHLLQHRSGGAPGQEVIPAPPLRTELPRAKTGLISVPKRPRVRALRRCD